MFLRKLISKFDKSITERNIAQRHKYEVPITVSFEPVRKTRGLNLPIQKPLIRGETKDLSKTGIAFIVSSIRFNEDYLVGDGRCLDVELKLPNGKVEMQIVGQRYEQFGDKYNSAIKFLIGAKIVQMSEADKELYEEFLRIGSTVQKNSASLEFGTDRS
ncbi:MAG: hypothetical protein WKF90_09055 [Pyrinomonadaceae bacterium]